MLLSKNIHKRLCCFVDTYFIKQLLVTTISLYMPRATTSSRLNYLHKKGTY